MKPYGQKHQKSKHHYKCHNPECIICNNKGWNTSKSRERHNTEEVEDFLNSDEITAYDELEYTVKLRALDDEVYGMFGLFEASSNVLNAQVIGLTPEHALDKMAHLFYDQDETH